jgi:hypothetical protein
VIVPEFSFQMQKKHLPMCKAPLKGVATAEHCVPDVVALTPYILPSIRLKLQSCGQNYKATVGVNYFHFEGHVRFYIGLQIL